MSALVAATSHPQLVPRVAPQRDRALPLIILLSVLAHAAVLLFFFWRPASDPSPSREIPVELVQMPKPVPPPAKPSQQRPPPKPVEKPQPHTSQPRKPPARSPAPKSASKPQARKPAAQPAASVAERMKSLLGPMPLAMPAVALPGQSASGTDAVSYPQLVLSQLAKAKKEGRHRGVPGRTTVAFTLGEAGQVVSVGIVGQSGDPSLDEEAIAMVHRGEPYPAPPIGGQRDYQITLVFAALP